MKYPSVFLAVLAFVFGLQACKKTSIITLPMASVNVTNVVVGGTALTYNTTTMMVGSNNYSQLTMRAGNSVLNLYPAATPNNPYYNQTIQTLYGDNYSLFLSGASPSAIDAVLVKENYTNYPDSVCGVRFINLSPNSNPISINIFGNASGSEVASLAYKAYTTFKQYPATIAAASYKFEIRDASTGNLITTYTMTTPYFNNVTIVLRGLITAPGILLVKNY